MSEADAPEDQQGRHRASQETTGSVATIPTESNKSDAEIINQVRSGKISAYGALYERHVKAAYNLARQLSRSPAEADDLVSEAFSKVLDTLRAGKGPDTAFRAYLLTALRHTAYDKTRKDRKIDLNEDMSTVGGAGAEALTVQFSDTAVAGLERTMAAQAFAKLPERWQAVLWHTEVERQTPAEVAPILGLTANGVSALAYRAREGLRQAYLQVHLAETAAERCRATAERLGAWTRDGLSKRERTQVETHLDECARCRALAAELADINGSLRIVVAPIVLGGAALGYLAATGAAKAGASTLGVAAVSAGTSAGAAAGASGAGGAGAGGAGAGAAAAAPRQFIGVAASGVAMAAAIAAGLAAGGGDQEIPAVAQQPSVQQPAPAPPPAPPAPPPPPQQPAVPPAPVPAPPAPSVQPPPPPIPPAASPTTSASPTSTPSTPSAPPPVAPPPPPPPSPPKLIAQGPAQGIELKQGGSPVDLPITVRNDGASISEPVTVTLTLPKGVQAVAVGGGGGAPQSGMDRADDTTAADTQLTVSCPAGTGTVSCHTEQGLAPGQSAVLTYRLAADQTAEPGVVQGSVSSGGLANVAVSVQVAVAEPEDQLGLRLHALWNSEFPWNRIAWVNVDVTNTGANTKPVTVTLDKPATLVLGHWRARCTATGTSTTCTSSQPLRPGESLRLWLELNLRPNHDAGVTATATLGSATQSRTVYFDCWWSCHDRLPSPPPTSSSTAPTTSPTAPLIPSVPPAPSGPLEPTVPTVPSAPSGPPTPTQTSPTSPPSPSTTTSNQPPGTPSTGPAKTTTPTTSTAPASTGPPSGG